MRKRTCSKARLTRGAGAGAGEWWHAKEGRKPISQTRSLSECLPSTPTMSVLETAEQVAGFATATRAAVHRVPNYGRLNLQY